MRIGYARDSPFHSMAKTISSSGKELESAADRNNGLSKGTNPVRRTPVPSPFVVDFSVEGAASDAWSRQLTNSDTNIISKSKFVNVDFISALPKRSDSSTV